MSPSAIFWEGQAGGTAQYRCRTPGGALERLGWDVSYTQDHIDVTLDGQVRGDPNVLVISRIMGAYLPDAIRRIVAKGRTKVVYDSDDWFAGIPAWNPAAKTYDDPQDNPHVMHEAMVRADLVTVSTPGLARLYKNKLGVQPVVLPNLLDPNIWGDALRYRTSSSKIRVGWLAAWRWRGGDVEVLRPWLKRWLEQHNDEVQFVALSCPEIADDLDIPVLAPPPLEGVSQPHLRPYEHLPAMLGNLDVGLCPLADVTFNFAGKSWCKAMEYNSVGIPAVCSPSEAYRDYVRPGVNGHLVRYNRKWAEALNRTIDDLDVLSEGARKVAEEHWIDDQIGRWVTAYAGRY